MDPSRSREFYSDTRLMVTGTRVTGIDVNNRRCPSTAHRPAPSTSAHRHGAEPTRSPSRCSTRCLLSRSLQTPAIRVRQARTTVPSASARVSRARVAASLRSATDVLVVGRELAIGTLHGAAARRHDPTLTSPMSSLLLGRRPSRLQRRRTLQDGNLPAELV